MKRLFSLTIALLLFSYAAQAQSLFFTRGVVQSFRVCRNSASNSIDTLTTVNDPSSGHLVNWNLLTLPRHGSVVAGYTGTSTGGNITPSGLSYQPVSGYVGNDSFTIEAADGSVVDTSHIIVSVDTLRYPGSISGPSAICIGSAGTYLDDTLGGSWISSNSSATIIPSTGMLTAISPGVDTIAYLMPANGCGTSAAKYTVTVDAEPNAGHLPRADSVCAAGGHLELTADGDAGGTWYSSNIAKVLVNDTGLITGVAAGTSTVRYVVTNSCGSDTAATTIKVQNHVLPIFATASTVCHFQTLLLIDASTGGTWSSSDFLVAPVLNGLVVGLTSGTATITYSLHNACGTTLSTLDITVTVCDSTAAVATTQMENEELIVYPNPNNGSFNIDLSSGRNEQATLFITNMVGQKVKEMNITTDHTTAIKLDEAAGIYFIKVLTASGISYTARVVATQ